MLSFNMQGIHRWSPVDLGVYYEFPIPAGGQRAVEFQTMSDYPVCVWGTTEGGSRWLLATGDGLLSVKFSVAENMAVYFTAFREDTFVMWRTFTEVPSIPAPVEASYTTIEPRPFSAGENLQRLMYVQELNRRKREKEIDRQMAGLRDAVRSRQGDSPSGKKKAGKAKESDQAPAPNDEDA